MSHLIEIFVDDENHKSAVKDNKHQYKIEKEAEHYHNDIYDVRVYKLWQMPYAENNIQTLLAMIWYGYL